MPSRLTLIVLATIVVFGLAILNLNGGLPILLTTKYSKKQQLTVTLGSSVSSEDNTTRTGIDSSVNSTSASSTLGITDTAIQSNPNTVVNAAMTPHMNNGQTLASKTEQQVLAPSPMARAFNASTNTSTSTSISASQQFEFDPIPGAKIAWYDHDNSSAISCSIDSNWSFLAHGNTHYAFATQMACRDDSLAASNSNTWSHPLHVVVRLSSHKINATTKERHFKSIKPAVSKRGRLFRDRIQGNWPPQEVDNYFVPTKGRIDLPSNWLLERLNNRASPWNNNNNWPQGSLVGVSRDEKDLSNSSSFTIEGDLSLLAPGKVGFGNRLSDPQTLKVVQHMTIIYYHLYRTRLIHCDMSNQHYLTTVRNNKTGDGQTRMFDFERVASLGHDQKAHKKQRYQLWQVLEAIAKVCAKGGGVGGSSTICHNNEWITAREMASHITKRLALCPFDVPESWNDLAGVEQHLAGNVSAAYDELISMVGLETHPLILLDRLAL